MQYKLTLTITGTQAQLLAGLQSASDKIRRPRPVATRGEAKAIKAKVKRAILDQDTTELSALMKLHNLYSAYCDNCVTYDAPVITTTKGAQCCQCSAPIHQDLTTVWKEGNTKGNISPVE